MCLHFRFVISLIRLAISENDAHDSFNVWNATQASPYRPSKRLFLSLFPRVKKKPSSLQRIRKKIEEVAIGNRLMRTVFYSFFFNFSFQMLSRTVCLFLSLSFSVQPHTSMRGHVCLSVYRSVDWSVGQANVEPAQKCRFQSPCNLITRRFFSHFFERASWARSSKF